MVGRGEDIQKKGYRRRNSPASTRVASAAICRWRTDWGRKGRRRQGLAGGRSSGSVVRKEWGDAGNEEKVEGGAPIIFELSLPYSAIQGKRSAVLTKRWTTRPLRNFWTPRLQLSRSVLRKRYSAVLFKNRKPPMYKIESQKRIGKKVTLSSCGIRSSKMGKKFSPSNKRFYPSPPEIRMNGQWGRGGRRRRRSPLSRSAGAARSGTVYPQSSRSQKGGSPAKEGKRDAAGRSQGTPKTVISFPTKGQNGPARLSLPPIRGRRNRAPVGQKREDGGDWEVGILLLLSTET